MTCPEQGEATLHYIGKRGIVIEDIKKNEHIIKKKLLHGSFPIDPKKYIKKSEYKLKKDGHAHTVLP
jgi:hypothetical protein